MTATAANPGRWHQLRMWLGHYATLISVVWSGWLVLTIILRPLTEDPPIWYALLYTVVTLGLVIAAFASSWNQRFHDRNLCLRDLAATPLTDPQREVERKMWALRAFHSLTLLALNGVFLLVVIVVLTHSATQHGWAGPAQLWVYLLITVYLVASTMVHVMSRIHRRLEPWCPLCRRGGGGGGSYFNPDPAPDPSMTTPRDRTGV